MSRVRRYSAFLSPPCLRSSVACSSSVLFFFFFQAEDGIRDGHVTGVQTCALPILARHREVLNPARFGLFAFQVFSHKLMRWLVPWFLLGLLITTVLLMHTHPVFMEIGRASCRERV